MSKEYNYNDVNIHIRNSINLLDTYFNDLLKANNLNKADKLAYWIEEWTKYISKEDTFKPERLIKYKRGSVIKINFGFNIGSEYGGLHYAIVLDKNNSISNPCISVLPLTSYTKKKESRKNILVLNDEIYNTLNKKYNSLEADIFSMVSEFHNKNNQMEGNELTALMKSINQYNNAKKEIEKLKKGSIALVSQITNLSKIRIYKPKNKYDIWYNIKLSSETMDKIDNEIKEFYCK